MQGALDELPDALPLLVTTGDHPLLTPEMVGHCARRAGRSADLVAGLTPSSAIRKAYPDAQRTYLRFRDERYSRRKSVPLLGLAAARGRRLAPGRRAQRPWRLVRAFGWRPLLAYLLGRLTLDQAMARASRYRRAPRRGRPAPR